ncbi:MAG: aminomethyl-transferring glycine dehydrogenase subunit GcvPA [Oscillospiraceae bacterium]|jgi:glycine dehydrogenase subunit 1|nr:aminomethyl-transferring glycine dehydrogenase subunit GcvPA [Oscillospiraceae bacterium]
MGSYVPATDADRAAMLAAVGVESLDELYAAIPASVRLARPLNLPEGASELEVSRRMQALAARNTVFPTLLRGAGAYRHFVPGIVPAICGKETFLTAYTPYQAEMSQGVLQAIFEFQTMVCELTDLDAANASVYDGATAAGEAAAMCRDRGRTRTLVSAGVNPQTLDVVRTYCAAVDAPLQIVPTRQGVTDLAGLADMAGQQDACLLVQQPNFYGLLEDIPALAQAAHAAGAKLIVSCNPIAMALLRTPGDCGADIAVGDGQPLGLPLAFGGPSVGFMAATAAMMRKLPGRIVGQTVDAEGRRAFVLTLQAREQHIRREKAGSNICSNQALCAMQAAVYLAAMGPAGLQEAARQSMQNAHALADLLCQVPGVRMAFPGPYFHEFVTTCPVPTGEALSALEARGILGGLPLEGELAGHLLWCATELNTPDEMRCAAEALREVCA